MARLSEFQAWVEEASRLVVEQSAHLTELDRAIGDADHGTNMERGLRACAELTRTEEFGAIDAYLKRVGMTLVGTVGGAAGPLYGTFFLRLAGPLAETEDATGREMAQALRAGVDGVVARGRAERGDKTMFDALRPALEAFERRALGGAALGECLRAAADAAAAGRDATEPLVARKGRASYLGERSAGHVDPGAASATLLLEAAASTLA